MNQTIMKCTKRQNWSAFRIAKFRTSLVGRFLSRYNLGQKCGKTSENIRTSAAIMPCTTNLAPWPTVWGCHLMNIAARSRRSSTKKTFGGLAPLNFPSPPFFPTPFPSLPPKLFPHPSPLPSPFLFSLSLPSPPSPLSFPSLPLEVGPLKSS